MPNPPSALAFDMLYSRYLIICMPNNTVRIFDVESKSFPPWQRDFSQTVSQRIALLNDPIIGVSFVPLPVSVPAIDSHISPKSMQHQSVVVWSANWICRFHFNPTNHPVIKKRARNDRDDSDSENEGVNGAGQEDQNQTQEETEGEDVDLRTEKAGNGKFYLGLIKKYRNILGIHFLNAQEMVVVERPLIDALSGLPPAYFQGKYGT